ncbi:MAG: UbiD family decarboxylase [Pseudomonadota bacterium]|nr:UbiD family decarboxylase [Pseudomonadota bacterium]
MSDDGLRGFMRQVNKQGDLDKRDLANKNNDAKRASRVQNIRDQSIRSFLEKLEKTGEMLRIRKEVDPATNLSAIEWKTYDQLGKSTIFDNIKGHPGWQACSQILADRKKWSLGLNLTEDEFLKAMLLKVNQPIEPIIQDSDSAPCKEVIKIGEKASLFDIPVVSISEDDGGPFIASGMAIMKDPDTGIRNMSIHRQQVFDAQTTGFLILPRQARRILEKYSDKKEPMPVAVVIGAHPAVFFGSAFTTTYGVDELAIAGGVLGDPIRLVKCETIDIEVPADAEIILEGEIHPGELRHEGPFGEVPGTYAEADDCEVFHVKAITHRRGPIYYALHCGAPTTCTQATTGMGIELATLDHLSKVEGGMDILDIRCHAAAGLMMVVVKLRPKISGQAKTALMATLSGPYLHPKLAIAVDEDIDASDLRQVMWSMTTRVNASNDVTLIPNTRTFALDKISPVPDGGHQFERLGTKWLIDATMPAVSRPSERARFARAMPKNFDSVNIEDFLPEEMF